MGPVLTVSVISQTKDRHGDPVSQTLKTVSAYGFAPTASTVDYTEKHTQADRYGALYMPAGSLDGLPAGVLYRFSETPGAVETTWAADGSGADWVWPWGEWRPGLEVRVKRVTG